MSYSTRPIRALGLVNIFPSAMVSVPLVLRVAPFVPPVDAIRLPDISLIQSGMRQSNVHGLKHAQAVMDKRVICGRIQRRC